MHIRTVRTNVLSGLDVLVLEIKPWTTFQVQWEQPKLGSSDYRHTVKSLHMTEKLKWNGIYKGSTASERPYYSSRFDMNIPVSFYPRPCSELCRSPLSRKEVCSRMQQKQQNVLVAEPKFSVFTVGVFLFNVFRLAMDFSQQSPSPPRLVTHTNKTCP